MNCIIEQFIVFRTNDGHKGYFQKTRSLDGESVNFSYYGISREQARTAQVLESHKVETAATAYWNYHFNMLSPEMQKLIKLLMSNLEDRDKSTLRMPNELATLARTKALKIMGETCPRCSGMGWYPSNIGNGTCFRCNGRGKILPKITDEFLEEFSKRLGGGKNLNGGGFNGGGL